MLCFKVRKRLVPYSEGTLSQREAEKVAAHLSRCRKCSDELKLIRSASSAFRSAKTPAMEPAPGLWSRIEREIAAPEPAVHRWRVRSLQYGGAIAAAAILLFTFINVSNIIGTGDWTGGNTGQALPEGSIENRSVPAAGEIQTPDNAGPAVVDRWQDKEELPSTSSTGIRSIKSTTAAGIPASPPKQADARSTRSSKTPGTLQAEHRPVVEDRTSTSDANLKFGGSSTDASGDTTGHSDMDFKWSNIEGLEPVKDENALTFASGDILSGPSGPGSLSTIGCGFDKSKLIIAGSPRDTMTFSYDVSSRVVDYSSLGSAGMLVARRPRSFEAPVTSVDLLNQADDQSRHLALFSYP